MSNIKQELNKITIPKELHDRAKVGIKQAKAEKRKKRSATLSPSFRKKALTAAICFVVATTVSFTPVASALQKVYDQIFSSQHIDDSGVRSAMNSGAGQELNEAFYDEKNDITVQFENIMTDDKETKLLLTYQSEKADMQNYYIDLFEGESTIYISDGEKREELKNVGWGSRYYDQKENKVAEALSFESIKGFEGKNIRLEIENITIYGENESGSIKSVWPVEFTLSSSAVSDRSVFHVNKEFTYQGETYKIKQIEFSGLETRVVISGSDTKTMTDENGMKYKVMSKLESQYLNARKYDKEYGYVVDETKTGIFLLSAGKKIEPIYSKGEVQGEEDEYIMTFAPVKDQQDCVLEIEGNINISLRK